MPFRIFMIFIHLDKKDDLYLKLYKNHQIKITAELLQPMHEENRYALKLSKHKCHKLFKKKATFLCFC